MQTEFEASFKNVDKQEIRQKLEALGAVCTKPETLYRRVAFNLPEGVGHENIFARVRDEGDRVTMTVKHFLSRDRIEDQKEAEVVIDDFDQGVSILTMLGCDRKAFQETKREIWEYNNAEIMIDEWPFLEPLVEIEGYDEEHVRRIAAELGFEYSEAMFDSVSILYAEKYGITRDQVNNQTPEILFDMENPFV